ALNNSLDIGESSLPNALPWDSLPRAPLSSWGDPEALIPALTARSHQRIETIASFQKINEQIQVYLKNQKGKKEVTLKEVMAEGKAAPAASQLDGAVGRTEPDKKAAGTDQALTEAENILLDYMQLSNKAELPRVVERRAS
ncbi:MAG TPA: carboxy terminal-processing peptidase, partial [bacterium]|nr:carboxy terminal-processing peptidase [bacterium]